ncbi:IclR family transcriptional regulator C-terminal domain-containing protein [Streptomyces sp. NPDC050988]|uniref:IclR family transcriptional regulator domain-containing protein n=1 Tax=Streptomyces sp. NPDC050988 TaxID=3365637 RepID=UPI0037B73F88
MANTETPADGPAPGERLEQLERAMAVLETFGHERPALTLSEVAQLTGIARASARRILLTLKALGYVKASGRTFSLTPKVLNLGWNYFASLGTDEITRELMADLVREIDESCSMVTLDLPDIVYVARVHTRRVMTVGGGIGARLPAHATASGRVLLAALDDEELDAYLAGEPLRAHTPGTLVDPDEFLAELEAVRERGWALVDQELETGLVAVAVPVTGRAGRTTAALSVSSNSARTTVDDLRERCLPPLRKTAEAVSTALAHGETRGTLA